MTDRAGIISAGNWIVDIVHEIAQWPRESELVRIGHQSQAIGGGAANVVAALAKLDTGLPLWPMGAVGDDDHGRFILAQCRDMGLADTLMRINKAAPTAHTHVMSVRGQTRTFFYQGGTNDALTKDDFPPQIFANTPARIFYLGYPMLLAGLDKIDADGTTGVATILERAKAAGMTTCVDLVSAQAAHFAQSVHCALPHIDYLVLNEIEAALATGHKPAGEGTMPADADLESMARKLMDVGVGRAVVLHSPEKILWSDATKDQVWTPTKPLSPENVVSPLGAGDAFCAGLLYAIHEGWPRQDAIALANATARASLKGITACEAIPSLKELGHDVIWTKESRIAL